MSDGDDITPIGLSTVTWKRTLPELPDIDDETFAKLSAQMAEHARIMADALFEAAITPLPPYEPEPIKYTGIVGYKMLRGFPVGTAAMSVFLYDGV